MLAVDIFNPTILVLLTFMVLDDRERTRKDNEGHPNVPRRNKATEAESNIFRVAVVLDNSSEEIFKFR